MLKIVFQWYLGCHKAKRRLAHEKIGDIVIQIEKSEQNTSKCPTQ